MSQSKKITDKVIIRKGVKEDVPAILGLIKELAEYEKAAHEVSNTVEAMQKDGFSNNPIFTVYIAEVGNKIVGILLYYIGYSTWKGKMLYLDDIVINIDYRQLGIGTMLINQLMKDAKEMGAKLVKWQVLDWNEPAIKFYEKMNVSFEKEWIDCKLFENQVKSYQAD